MARELDSKLSLTRQRPPSLTEPRITEPGIVEQPLATKGSSRNRLRYYRFVVPAALGFVASAFQYSFLSGNELRADDSDFFSHNYAAVGIMQEGATQMTPSVEVEFESKHFDTPSSAHPVYTGAARPAPRVEGAECDGPCNSGRFANRQTGVEGRVVPADKFGEKVRLDY